MDTAHLTYIGDLRTEAVHSRSHQRITTDAPPDNHGKGEAFSPTDLLCAALASCMMTTIGLTAHGHGIPLKHMEAHVVKHMAPSPRRVARVEVDMVVVVDGLTDRWRQLIEHSARTCPVALSLAESVEQDLRLRFT